MNSTRNGDEGKLLTVEKRQARRTASLHRHKVDTAQSQLSNAHLVQRQINKQESLLQNLQNTHHLDNIKLKQKNDQFLKNLTHIMHRKNMFNNEAREQEKYDDQVYGREGHTYSVRKKKLKEISYQNLNILTRIRNVKSVVSKERVGEAGHYAQKGYSSRQRQLWKNKENSRDNLTLPENQRPFYLPKASGFEDKKRFDSTKDEIILFHGNVQVKQQIYNVKLQKKKTCFRVDYLLQDYQQHQGNTHRQTFSNKTQCLEIQDCVGFQLMAEHEYQYDKICGFIVYKHIFRQEKFDGYSDASSAKFNKIIKTEFRNSQRKNYYHNRLNSTERCKEGFRTDCQECQQEKKEGEREQIQEVKEMGQQEQEQEGEEGKEGEEGEEGPQQLHTYS